MFKKKKKPDGNAAVTLDDVLAGLTVDEKIDLLSGADFWFTHPVPEAQIRVPKVMMTDGPIGLRKQDIEHGATNENDSITAVCFPAGAGLAASFDRAAMSKLGDTLGRECLAEKVDTLLGPAINIKRNPLCGRNFEYLSEDPYLAGELAAAYVKALEATGTGSCPKHFAGNNQEKRRMTVDTVIDERALREIYLPAFENVVRNAAPRSIMVAYNGLNGHYCTENKRLLTDILRDEWGFKGLAMSDWGAVNDRAKALSAGLDLEMPGSYGIGADSIRAALGAGEITEEDIDRSARRMLNFIFKGAQTNREGAEFDLEADHKIALELALRSMVLLKNDGDALPLYTDDKPLFVGEFALKPRYQGGGSSHIKSYRVSSPLYEAKKRGAVDYSKGFSVTDIKPDEALIADAMLQAKKHDIIVVFAGLPESVESEGFDRADMRLPECQNELISRLAKTDKRVIVVLNNGSPVEMPWADDVDAILEAYLPGEAAGEAETAVLYGEYNPSGKLAETFPKSYKDVPSYQYFPGTYNTTEYRESIYVGYRYYNTFGKDVLFPFGHGLSYTAFRYDNMRADAALSPNGKIKIAVTVANTGDKAGEEVVQFYVKPKAKPVFRPSAELRAFSKISLEAGASGEVEVELDESAFSYYNVKENRFVCDDGEYEILAAASSEDVRCVSTVTLSGFGAHEAPYDEEVNRLWADGDVTRITQKEFSALYGEVIKTRIPAPPFTAENALIDMKDTKFGSAITKLVPIVTKFTGGEAITAEMQATAALETPLRSVAAMSGGRLNKDVLNGLIDIMNGKGVGAAAKALISVIMKS